MDSILVFKIIHSPLPSNAQPHWRVPDGGGVIGRAPECDWVLRDPDRLVSRRHAHVNKAQHQCVWTDLGTNSSLLNGKRLSPGECVNLVVGDELRVGEYALELTLQDDIWRAETNRLQREDRAPEVDCEHLFGHMAQPEMNIDSLLQDTSLSLHLDVENSSWPAPKLPALESEVIKLRRLLKASIKGYMRLLQARRVFLDETRAGISTMSATGNNPLKRCQSFEEAFDLMMDDGAAGYLGAEQAFEQACQDLLLHQQASVSRIQALIDQAKSQLDPELIMKQAEHAGGFGLALNPSRKARLWDLYCNTYRSFAQTWN